MYLRSPMKNEEMNKTLKLSKRLRVAADLVRKGSYIADVGTDHAYLPIALCLEDRVRGAVASDINEGPILRAREHIKEYGLEARIDTVLADGLDKISPYEPNDILILGMGGELIANIISRASFVKNEAIRLILQPMTHPEVLASYLAENGFETVDEIIVQDGGRDDRIYRIICARYSGVRYEISDVEALIGKKNIVRRDGVTVAYVERLIRVLDARIQGKKSAGQDTASEDKLVLELKKILEA